MTPVSFQLVSDLLNFCQLTVRNILERWKNDDTKTLYNLTSKNFVSCDAAISNKDHGKAVKSSYNNSFQNGIQQNLSNFKNKIMNHLQQVVSKYKSDSWHKQIQNLPPNIFPFRRIVETVEEIVRTSFSFTFSTAAEGVERILKTVFELVFS